MGENDCNEAKAFYKQKITEMVANCDNEEWLKLIYIYVKRLLEQKKSQGFAHCPWLFFILLGFDLRLNQ